MKNILYSLLATLLFSNFSFGQIILPSDEEHRIMMNTYVAQLNNILTDNNYRGTELDLFKKEIASGVSTLPAQASYDIIAAAAQLLDYGGKFATTKGLTADTDALKYFYSSFAPSTVVQNGKLIESNTTSDLTGAEMWTCALESFNTNTCNANLSALVGDKTNLSTLATSIINRFNLNIRDLATLVMLNGFGGCINLIELNHLNYNDLVNNSVALYKIENLAGSTLNPNEESIYIDLLGGFRVFVNDFVYRAYGGKSAYTFRISRGTETEGILENLVLRSNDQNEYEAFFFRYSLTKTDAELLQNNQPIPDLKHKVQVAYFQDTPNATARTTIYILETRECEDWIILAANPRYAGEIWDFAGIETECHSVFEIFESWDFSYVIAPGDGFNSGGGGGGGGGGSPTDEDCTSASTGGGTYVVPINTTPDDNGNNSGFNPILTRPTLAPCGLSDLKKQCNKIKNNLNENTAFKTKMKELSTSENLNLNYEKAAGIIEGISNVNEWSGEANAASANININPSDKITALFHTHSDGGTPTYSVFSPEDLRQIARWIRLGNINNDKFVAYLATKKGTYLALTISDPQNFLDLFYSFTYVGSDTLPLQADAWERIVSSEKKLNPLLKKYFEPANPNRLIKETDTANENVIKHFLNFMKEADAGIDLFETDANFTNFTKLELKNNEIDRTNSCN